MDKQKILKSLTEILETSKVDLSKKSKKRKELIDRIIKTVDSFLSPKSKSKKPIKSQGIYVYTAADSARSDAKLGRGPG